MEYKQNIYFKKNVQVCRMHGEIPIFLTKTFRSYVSARWRDKNGIP